MSSERERILAYQGRQLDWLVAEHVMGWVVEEHDGKPPHFHRMSDKTHWTWLHEWLPSEDWNDCHQMEDEIERRGLLRPYTLEMLGILIDQAETGEAICPQCGRPDLKIRPVEGKALSTLLLRASCPDRCRAALLVVGDAGE